MAEFVFLDENNKSLGIAFDAVIMEDHSSEATITSNPVENGSEITDHMQVVPSKLVLDIAVSDLKQVGDAGSQSRGTKSASVWSALRDLQASREPFKVVTGLRLYPNMQIESMTTRRDKATSKMLRASLTLKELILIETETISASFSSPKQDGTHARVGAVSERGTVNTEAPTTEEETKTRSILSDLVN